MQQGRKKVKIKITSVGMLVSFGYHKLRTPAVVELYPNEIAILKSSGTQFEDIESKEDIEEKSLVDTKSKEISKSLKKHSSNDSITIENVDQNFNVNSVENH